MTPYEVYKEYLALRNHFNNASYDYFKYLKKSSAKADSFNKRKDKFFFEKVAKHKDPHNFILANFVHNPKSWIRDMAYSEDAERIYQEWLKRKESLTYVVKNDLEKLQFPFDSNFIIKNNQHSYVLSLYLGGRINIETICVLSNIVDCIPYWDKQMKDDFVWQQTRTLIKKYTPFIRYDSAKMKEILLDFFSDAG
jgi:hypothetical protein